MTTWTYMRTEPYLWTVGFHAPDDTWHTDSDHGSKDEAAARVRWLNGGPDPTVAIEDMPAFRRMLLLLKVQFDAGGISGEFDNAEAFALLTRLCAEYEVA